MRAIIVDEPGGPEVMHWGDAATPEPGHGEIRVKVAAAGVNRADLLQRQGHYPPPKGITDIIGLEAAGTVDAIGPGVEGWHKGDECVALVAGGAYAEYLMAPAGQLVRPPAGVDLVTAATLMEVAATVVSNFDHVHLSRGETVLIHGGAGGIGSFAIQYAKQLGCRVAVTAGSPDKLQYCRDLGADIAIDYHTDWPQDLKDATDGAGADVILDVMGAKYLELNVASLARGGRQVTIGMQGGVKGTLNLGVLLNKNATVTATSLRFRPVDEKIEICRRVAESVWPMIESGAIQPAPLETFAMPDASKAHERLASGKSHGKLALTL